MLKHPFVIFLMFLMTSNTVSAATTNLLQITYGAGGCIDEIKVAAAGIPENSCGGHIERKRKSADYDEKVASYTCAQEEPAAYRTQTRVYDRLCDKSAGLPTVGFKGDVLKKHHLVYYTSADGKTVGSCVSKVTLVGMMDRTNPAACEIERTRMEEGYQRAFQNISASDSEVFELECSPTKFQGQQEQDLKDAGRWCTKEQLNLPRMAPTQVVQYYRHHSPDADGADSRAAGIVYTGVPRSASE